MDNFINNFKKLISKNWNSPEEKEIIEYFRANSKKILGDESLGQQFIDDFIASNKYMYDLTSDDFKKSIETLNSEFLQENKTNNGVISENKNKMNKNIKVGLKNWNIKVNGKKIVVTEGKNVHQPFIQPNGQVVWDAPHTIPYIIKESVADMSLAMLGENTTADISIPEIPATNQEALERVNRFDPYGNAQNKVAGSKTEVKVGDKFDKLTFKESVSKLDKDKVFVIDQNLTEDTGMYSSILIEHKTKQHHIVIDKKDFNTFVRRNCLIENYVKKGNFDFNAYINSRSRGMLNTIIKEYFDAQNKSDDSIKVDYVERNDGEIHIVYWLGKTQETGDIFVPEEEFFIFCQNNDPDVTEYAFEKEDGNDDHPMGIGLYFDEDMYYEHGDINGMALKFVLSKTKQ